MKGKYENNKRYFISNYNKNKMVVMNLVGEPKCIICGNRIILDIHHVKKDKIAIFLCPNHHQTYHRAKRTGIIVKNQKYYESKKKGSFRFHEDETLDDIIYLIKKVENRTNSIYVRECKLCGYIGTSDTHHFGNMKRGYLHICPNHHAMLHRIFSDKKGELLISKEEIRKKILEVEDKKMPYYIEVSKESYLKKYAGYQIIKIKNPKDCKQCGLWFYPTKEHKEICKTCFDKEAEKLTKQREDIAQAIHDIDKDEVSISELARGTNLTKEEINNLLARNLFQENGLKNVKKFVCPKFTPERKFNKIKVFKIIKDNKTYFKIKKDKKVRCSEIGCNKEMYYNQGIYFGDGKIYEFYCPECFKKNKQFFKEFSLIDNSYQFYIYKSSKINIDVFLKNMESKSNH